jgi:quinone-modifying oxidoreductase subunit QmoC
MESPAKVIRPDLEFVNRIVKSGGETLKQCMQCANCSIACELSPDSEPFPRKEMLLAQWGQKEELFTDPDIWLCFGCTDCSVECPRGARPGDVLGAVRKETIRRFSPFGFVQTALSSAKWLPVLVLVPVVLWGALYLMAHDPEGSSSYFDGVFPPGILEPVLGAMTLLGMSIFAVGATRYWKALVAKHPAPAGASFVGAWFGAATEVISHARFRKCEAGNRRSLGHMLMFFGFTVIFLGGTLVGMGSMFLGLKLPLDHPDNPAFWTVTKVLLNVGAVALLIGTSILLRYRLTRPERQTKGSWFDWFFLGALFVAGATGLLTELLRRGGLREVAFGVYFVHLVCVFCLLGYAPWSKLAHLVYRTVALAHAKYTHRIA